MRFSQYKIRKRHGHLPFNSEKYERSRFKIKEIIKIDNVPTCNLIAKKDSYFSFVDAEGRTVIAKHIKIPAKPA